MKKCIRTGLKACVLFRPTVQDLDCSLEAMGKGKGRSREEEFGGACDAL